MATREELFGVDLSLVERAGGFDLIAGGAGDLALARGNDNVAQALTLRLLVRRGELAPLGWPDYGSRLHELIGEPNTARTHVRLMAWAREAVERDPRVVEVTDVRTEVLADERGIVRLHMEVLLVDAGDPVPLSLSVPLEEA